MFLCSIPFYEVLSDVIMAVAIGSACFFLSDGMEQVQQLASG